MPLNDIKALRMLYKIKGNLLDPSKPRKDNMSRDAVRQSWLKNKATILDAFKKDPEFPSSLLERSGVDLYAGRYPWELEYLETKEQERRLCRLLESKSIHSSKNYSWNGQGGQKVKIVGGEYQGKLGTILGEIPRRYNKSPVTYRVQIDGFGKPGGWDGKVPIEARFLEKA